MSQRYPAMWPFTCRERDRGRQVTRELGECTGLDPEMFVADFSVAYCSSQTGHVLVPDISHQSSVFNESITLAIKEERRSDDENSKN
jgi:hypothetical protein